MAALDQILKYLDQAGATEVVIESGKPITVRIFGEVRAVTPAPLEKTQVELMMQHTALTMLKGTGKPERMGIGGKKYTVTMVNRGTIASIKIEKPRGRT